MNHSLFNEMLEQGYVIFQKHPTENLFIYNYSTKTQYERVWNEVTLACRGLILDADGNFIARPFGKFFNLGEMENQLIPNEPFEVYEKMDGSLGITYWVNGEVKIATRGSFISEQAEKAMQILDKKYPSAKAKMNPDFTYLFEIIYPSNRIVVDYGEAQKLVLLGILETKTGKEMPLEDVGIPIVKKYDGLNDIQALKKLEEPNREGFVIKFESGYRLKVKFEEYVRIHKIISQVSSISIWEYLMTEQPMDEILAQIPDEFYDWVKAKKAALEAQYLAIETQAKAEFKTFETRKETALYFMQCSYPKILFSMLDGRDYSQTIWRLIRPEFEKPFWNTSTTLSNQ